MMNYLLIIPYVMIMTFLCLVTQIIGEGKRSYEQRLFYWNVWPLMIIAVFISAPFVEKNIGYWAKLKDFFINELFPTLFNYGD